MNFPRTAWRWMIAVTVVIAVSTLFLRQYYPPLPSPLTLDLILDRHEPGRTDPLIVSGRTGAGDFLFVRHLADDRVAFGYDSWGEPGLASPPVKLPANRTLRLVVEMPALTQIRGVFAPATNRLRVVANGTGVFDTAAEHHIRQPAEIQFGVNSIGGTACAATLNGRLLLPDGRELRGFPESLTGLRERLAGWLLVSRWQALGTLLLGIAIVVGWERLRPRELLGRATALRRDLQLGTRLSSHRIFVVTALACTLAFTWMVSYGTLKLTYPETFGNFYDHQAESLLQGRLDVHYQALNSEAFIFDGKIYGYFGLTPALLRIPCVILGVGFGQLTRWFMVLYFAATLLACYLLLRTVRELAGRGVGAPPAWATLCFVGGAGLGSTLFFLGSRAYVYHEAILSGVTFALFAGWCALRHFAAPETRWWIGALAGGILAVHARPPVGLFALSFLGVLAIAAIGHHGRPRPTLARRQILIAAACGFGVFTFNLVSYAKFRTFEGCPLRYNVQYDAPRLARIDGRQFHLVNLPITIDYYLVRPNFRFEPGFPYFFIGRTPPGRPFPASKIDYQDKTLGFPYAMPGLFGLAVFGGLAALTVLRPLRLVIAATWAAGVPMTLAMFTAIAITHRYTADFCPLLLTAAAFGVVGIEASSRPWQRLLQTAALAATGLAVLITFAITLHHQGNEVWGVPDKVRENYAALRQNIDRAVGKIADPAR